MKKKMSTVEMMTMMNIHSCNLKMKNAVQFLVVFVTAEHWVVSSVLRMLCVK